MEVALAMVDPFRRSCALALTAVGTKLMVLTSDSTWTVYCRVSPLNAGLSAPWLTVRLLKPSVAPAVTSMLMV